MYEIAMYIKIAINKQKNYEITWNLIKVGISWLVLTIINSLV